MRDGDFELVTLKNGHRAVRHLGHGEVMHPSVGPWAEACALYVEQLGLAEALGEAGPELVVYDVGLGAGTNAVAALTRAAGLGPARRRPLRVESFEVDLAPLRLALADAAGFPFLQPWADAARALADRGAWEGPGLGLGLTWRLHAGDALAALERPELPPADLVFFDPFSPAANPGMWTPDALARVLARCGPRARLATYSASTRTRVSLLLAGWHVGAGSATGLKGETTVAAVRREDLAAPLGARWLERWERSSARAPHGADGLTPSDESRLRRHPQWG